MKFDRFALLLLVRKDPPPALSEAESARVQDAHLAHLARLHEQGSLLAAGPLRGKTRTGLAGVCLFRGSVARARALERVDPAVRAGFFDIEVVPWSVPAGAMRFRRARFPRSMKDASSP